MRRVGRRWSGGSTEDDWKCRGSKVTSSAEELTKGVTGRKAVDACKFSLNAARSGAVACGKVASRQPSQTDASFVSIDEERMCWFCFSALSRVQDDTQATNSHRKLMGRNAATSLLSGKRDINTTRIIQIRFALSHYV
jgi:hypothetical protein